MEKENFFSVKSFCPYSLQIKDEMCNCGSCCEPDKKNLNNSDICPPCAGVPIALPIAFIIDIISFIPRKIF